MSYSMSHFCLYSYFFAGANLNQSKLLNLQTPRCFTDLHAY
jgi:hypothetical protein